MLIKVKPNEQVLKRLQSYGFNITDTMWKERIVELKIYEYNRIKHGLCVIGKLYGRDLTREKVRIRDKQTCQMCGKKWTKNKRKFDVHHIDCDKKKTQLYENYAKNQHNMITLCHKCHMNIPEHKKNMSDRGIYNNKC